MESSSSSNDIICSFENEWTFKKADLMAKENRGLNGKCFYAYNIPGLQYFVRIYPNGFGEKTRGGTWLSFVIKPLEDRKVGVSFSLVSFGVESVNLSKPSSCIFREGVAISVCKTEEFFEYKSKYFVNGEIAIKIKGIFETECPLIPIVSAPISMEWKIKEYDLKCAMEESNKKYLYGESVTIASLSGAKYYLSIRPNYINGGKKSETVLYFYVELENETKIKAVVDFSIVSANYIRGFQHYIVKSKGYGIRLCSTADLFNPSKGFLVNGVLTVNLNGILIVEKCLYFSLHCKNNFISTSALKPNDNDFAIIVGNKEIHVNKKCLMDASPHLVGMKEFMENKMIINDFDF
uniref:MATH domain-containing protein n=1 Tax=Panagrolaimus sp. PS1159 TaxID=55785 RepID=A0AC35FXC7_9BILA